MKACKGAYAKRRGVLAAALALCIAICLGCGPGWEGYDDQYSEVTDVSGGLWEGDEAVIVKLADAQVEVRLEGMQIRDFQGAESVLLSELIIQASLTDTPELFRYNFTATDGYDLLIKRYEDLSLLPSWEEMKNGYLYYDSRYDDLTSGWVKSPWGSAECAYNVKWMNGGTITLLAEE